MNIPAVSGKKLVDCLVKKFNFKIIRQKGSHVILDHYDGRVVVVPCHGNKDLSKGLLIKIIKKEIKISLADFVKVFCLLFMIQ